MAHAFVRRTQHRLHPDPRRVIAKPYLPGEEIAPDGESRAGLLMKRILTIPEARLSSLLDDVLSRYSSRHHRFGELLERNFQMVAHLAGPPAALSAERRLLIGAYFTHEYSIEAAALCNPSIVWAPDQRGCRAGESRFVMSLRAVGEGHISSIELRSGIIDGAGQLTFDPPGAAPVTGQRAAPSWYGKRQFEAKLIELGAGNELATRILARLPDRFTRPELDGALAWMEQDGPSHAISYETIKMIRVLAASSYITTFPSDSALGERVLFPAGPYETRGMEDARFVRFVEDDGSVRYYATYTAYDGFGIFPQLIETDDFRTFGIMTLNGAAAQNKGMALFPRRIAGRYVMLSRKDRENLHLATSDDVRFWNDVSELRRPVAPWQLVQIGNCGSPIETEAGWLVITHGVGPMRQYAIGAMLLDLDDPSEVIGELETPLLSPDAGEREGYVPNVLYSCGAIVNGDALILPYGFSDWGISVAQVDLPPLLAALKSAGAAPAGH
jgi:predicted GH43/DUF377 family glycosyl hydrolase